jgi:phosphohistidine phosphatase
MMELYFLRHGIAVERGTEGFEDDTLRPLTPKGERRMRRIAEAMKKLDLSFDLLLSSRLVRARQTAELVAKTLKASDRLKFSSHLAPEGNSEDLVHDLKHLFQRPKSVLLVGHEPYLSDLMATLLTGRSTLNVNFKKGGLCLLTVDALHHGPCAILEWLLTPRQMSLIR